MVCLTGEEWVEVRCSGAEPAVLCGVTVAVSTVELRGPLDRSLPEGDEAALIAREVRVRCVVVVRSVVGEVVIDPKIALRVVEATSDQCVADGLLCRDDQCSSDAERGGGVSQSDGFSVRRVRERDERATRWAVVLAL